MPPATRPTSWIGSTQSASTTRAPLLSRVARQLARSASPAVMSRSTTKCGSEAASRRNGTPAAGRSAMQEEEEPDPNESEDALRGRSHSKASSDDKRLAAGSCDPRADKDGRADDATMMQRARTSTLADDRSDDGRSWLERLDPHCEASREARAPCRRPRRSRSRTSMGKTSAPTFLRSATKA